MRVKDIMSRDIETISPQESIVEANEKMWRQRIHHLVVMDGDRVAGVLSDTDLGGPKADSIPDNGKVQDFMSDKVVTIKPDESLDRAVNVMKGHGIHCLPVLEQEHLVGIVTLADVETLEKRRTAQPPFQGLEPHQGPYIPREFREEDGTSKIHHPDWRL